MPDGDMSSVTAWRTPTLEPLDLESTVKTLKTITLVEILLVCCDGSSQGSPRFDLHYPGQFSDIQPRKLAILLKYVRGRRVMILTPAVQISNFSDGVSDEDSLALGALGGFRPGTIGV